MSDTPNTVKVKPWGDGQGDFVVINEADFDPAVHVRLEPAADATVAGNELADWSELSADELKAIAISKGLTFRANASKATLIELLSAS